MPLNSVNTNIGAMTALRSLAAVNAELFTVQRRIATGYRVASAKDDPAVWAIAQRQRATSRALDSVKDSLQRGRGVVDMALAGAESISDLLMQMKEKALAASDPSLAAADKAVLSNDYVALRKQIDRVVENASFSGRNLISPSETVDVHALANADATDTIDVARVDLSTTTGAVSGTLADLTGPVGAADLDAIDAAMEEVNAAAAHFGVGASAIDSHLTFIGKQQDVLEASIGRLVDADLVKESARLQALQVKQQLAVMALSIANQAPSILLQLFQRR